MTSKDNLVILKRYPNRKLYGRQQWNGEKYCGYWTLDMVRDIIRQGHSIMIMEGPNDVTKKILTEIIARHNPKVLSIPLAHQLIREEINHAEV